MCLVDKGLCDVNAVDLLAVGVQIQNHLKGGGVVVVVVVVVVGVNPNDSKLHRSGNWE